MAFITIANFTINTNQITDIEQGINSNTSNKVYLSNGRSYLLSDKDLDRVFDVIYDNHNPSKR